MQFLLLFLYFLFHFFPFRRHFLLFRLHLIFLHHLHLRLFLIHLLFSRSFSLSSSFFFALSSLFQHKPKHIHPNLSHFRTKFISPNQKLDPNPSHLFRHTSKSRSVQINCFFSLLFIIC